MRVVYTDVIAIVLSITFFFYSVKAMLKLTQINNRLRSNFHTKQSRWLKPHNVLAGRSIQRPFSLHASSVVSVGSEVYLKNGAGSGIVVQKQKNGWLTVRMREQQSSLAASVTSHISVAQVEHFEFSFASLLR